MIRLENALKISLQDVLKMSWSRLGDVLKISCWHFCKTSWRRLEDVLARRLWNILKTYWRRMAKTHIFALTKTSVRRLENIFWRRKTSWRRLLKTNTKDVFKSSLSRWILAGLYHAEGYSEPCQTSRMELLGKITNSLQTLIIFAKNSKMFDRVLNTPLPCQEIRN